MTIIDTGELLEYLEGDVALLQDAYEIFCDENQVALSDLQAAIAADDVEAIHQNAHRIKGMLSNFQAHSACDTAQHIELIAASADAPPLVEKLANQIETVHTEIKQIIQSAQSNPDRN